MKGRVGKNPPGSVSRGYNLKAAKEHSTKFSRFFTTTSKTLYTLERTVHNNLTRGYHKDFSGVMRGVSERPLFNNRGLQMPQELKQRQFSSTKAKAFIPSLTPIKPMAVVAPTTFASFVQTREASTLVKTSTNEIVPKRNATTSTASTIARNPDPYQKHFFEYSSMALLVSMPAPLLISMPSAAAFGLDMVTAVVLPLHGYLGMKLVIDDYLPQAGVNGIANLLLILLTAVTVGGLFYVNISGDGISGSIKQMWQKRIAEHK